VEFRVLGPLEIVAAGEPINVDAPKQRAILAMLIIHANEVVSTDQLLEAVWGEKASDISLSTLRAYVSKLREVLPADVVVTKSPGYLLDVAPDAVDQVRFEELVAEARKERATDPAGAPARNVRPTRPGRWSCLTRRWACGGAPPTPTSPTKSSPTSSQGVSKSCAEGYWRNVSRFCWRWADIRN
jgi:hypothetical protein